MQIHNVFCLSFETLSRVLCALRLNLPPPAQLINGLPTYLVRRLMEVRRGRRLQRFVNWEGYMLEEPSWVPQSAILDKTMLRDNHPDKPGGSPEGSCLGATLTVLKSFCASLSLSVKCVVCLCVCLPPLHHTWSNQDHLFAVCWSVCHYLCWEQTFGLHQSIEPTTLWNRLWSVSLFPVCTTTTYVSPPLCRSPGVFPQWERFMCERAVETILFLFGFLSKELEKRDCGFIPAWRCCK